VECRRDREEAEKWTEGGQFICHEHSHRGGLTTLLRLNKTVEETTVSSWMSHWSGMGGGTSAPLFTRKTAEATILGSHLCAENMRAACM
jgi:hypothetical protein